MNVNLSNVKTKSQLHRLFFDDEIKVAQGLNGPGMDESFTIPIAKRLYVLEVSPPVLLAVCWCFFVRA